MMKKERTTQKDQIQKEIEQIDSKINSLINKIYGITDDELEELKS